MQAAEIVVMFGGGTGDDMVIAGGPGGCPGGWRKTKEAGTT